MKKRIIIISLDRVPFDLIDNLSKNGIMPNTSRLIEDRITKKMESSIPEVASVAWSFIITDKNPGEHVIFGFTDLIPKTYKLIFPNFNDFKS